MIRRLLGMFLCNSKGISTSAEKYKKFATGLLARGSQLLFYGRNNKALRKIG